MALLFVFYDIVTTITTVTTIEGTSRQELMIRSQLSSPAIEWRCLTRRESLRREDQVKSSLLTRGLEKQREVKRKRRRYLVVEMECAAEFVCVFG